MMKTIRNFYVAIVVVLLIFVTVSCEKAEVPPVALHPYQRVQVVLTGASGKNLLSTIPDNAIVVRFNKKEKENEESWKNRFVSHRSDETPHLELCTPMDQKRISETAEAYRYETYVYLKCGTYGEAELKIFSEMERKNEGMYGATNAIVQIWVNGAEVYKQQNHEETPKIHLVLK